MSLSLFFQCIFLLFILLEALHLCSRDWPIVIVTRTISLSIVILWRLSRYFSLKQNGREERRLRFFRGVLFFFHATDLLSRFSILLLPCVTDTMQQSYQLINITCLSLLLWRDHVQTH
jgi:hypothetical protein